MKQLTFTFLFFFMISVLNAQVQNDIINYELQQMTSWSNFDSDGANGTGEYVLKTTYYLGGNPITTNCLPWLGQPYVFFDYPAGNWALFGQSQYDAPFDISIEGWESDVAGTDYCNYAPNLNEYYTATASDMNPITNTIVGAGGPSQWNQNYGNNHINDWIFVTSDNSHNFDIIIRAVWRYANGDNCDQPLNYGSLSLNSNYSNINSNLDAPDGVLNSTTPVAYTDTDGQSSNDVFYSFTLTEATNVVISTDNPETNFDTQITLYEGDCNNQIGDDDDGGTGTTSLLDAQLCAGTYLVKVEGYLSNEGTFNLSLATSPLSPITVEATPVNVSCPSDATGELSASIGGGLTNIGYTVEWSNGSTSESISNLAIGTYTITVTDECGTVQTESFSITSLDTEDPVLVCGNTSIEITSGNPITLSQSNMSNVNAIDNCSNDDISYSFSPSVITESMGGDNTISVTATDASGNTSNCTFTLTVDIPSGVNDLEKSISTSIFPNPSKGSFTLKWAGSLPGAAEVKLLDTSGRVLQKETLNESGEHLFDLNNAPRGLYFVQIISADNTLTRRVLVQ